MTQLIQPRRIFTQSIKIFNHNIRLLITPLMKINLFIPTSLRGTPKPPGKQAGRDTDQ
jgi:hypothetical protein